MSTFARLRVPVRARACTNTCQSHTGTQVTCQHIVVRQFGAKVLHGAHAAIACVPKCACLRCTHRAKTRRHAPHIVPLIIHTYTCTDMVHVKIVVHAIHRLPKCHSSQSRFRGLKQSLTPAFFDFAFISKMERPRKKRLGQSMCDHVRYTWCEGHSK